jgi:hypothetical protein
MRFRLSLTLAASLLFATASAAEPTLNLADQPVRLIRGTVVFKAVNGTPVQKDDLLETGAAGVQVEAGPGAIVALGPHTRVAFQGLATDGKGALDVALLQGWIKVLAKAPARAVLTTSDAQVTLPSGSTILHSDGGKDALFAEEGGQQAAKLDERGRPGAAVKLSSEQFASTAADKAQWQTGRPPHDFVAAMPPGFRDALELARPVPRAGKIAPVKERDAAFADVADWLQAAPPLRRGLAARFRARLADPDFRKAADAALGQIPEWKALLHPVPVPPKPTTPTTPSSLF